LTVSTLGLVLLYNLRKVQNMRRCTWVLALVAIMGLCVLPAAAYHEVGPTGEEGRCAGLNMADNKDHSIFLDSSVGGGMRNAISAVRTESLDPTTIETYTETDPSGYTDVEVFQAENSGTYICGVSWSGVSGVAWCTSVTPSLKCEKHVVEFNTDNVSTTTPNRRRWAACQELGHTLGLKHDKNENSCMLDSFYQAPNTYSQHDRDMFYNYY